MTDIRTAREVEYDGEYKVIIADHDGGYEASVVSERVAGELLYINEPPKSDNNTEWGNVTDAPKEWANEESIAVGRAIAAYENDVQNQS